MRYPGAYPILSIVAASLLTLASCSDAGDHKKGAVVASLAYDAKAILLHHSTGGVIWGGGIADALTAHNTAQG